MHVCPPQQDKILLKVFSGDSPPLLETKQRMWLRILGRTLENVTARLQWLYGEPTRVQLAQSALKKY